MDINETSVIARVERLATRLTGRDVYLSIGGPLMSIIVNFFLILVAFAGLVAASKGLRFGQSLIFGAFIWSLAHTLILKAKQGGNAQPDERERVLSSNAAAVGAWALCSLMGIWCLIVGGFAEYGVWYPDTDLEWRSLGFFIIGLTSQVTNIVSAWMTPAYASEIDVDE
ncbi:MAG: hypothetical protein ACK4ZE_09250 [Sphingorhabdus sp.]